MQKRFFLALALSFLVLFVWQSFVVKPKKPVTPPQAPITAEKIPADNVVEPQQPAVQANLTEYQLNTALAQYLLIDQNAEVKQAVFKKYKDYVFPLLNGFQINTEAQYVRQDSGNNRVSYISTDAQKRITKELVFSDENYEGKLTVTVENLGGSALKYSFPLALGTLDLARPATQGAGNFQDISVSTVEKYFYPSIKKNDTFSSVKFLALRDHYFCAIVQPADPKYSAQVKTLNNKQTLVSLVSPEFDIAPGGKVVQNFRIYLGPQDLKLLSAANFDWQSVVYFGKLDALAQILLKTLSFFHSVARNWGLAIIIVSVLIYLILYPLTLKQFRSMKEIQLVQPKVEALRCKYKDDPMRQQKEIMEIYKEHKINPLGGCLPMLLQLPIFFSFYMVLSRSIELKGANFLWIRDLAEPDKLVVLPQAVPFLGNEINLLPVLMVIASFIQQKFSSGQMSGTSAEQQKMMLYLFPLMFGVFFYHMPSGLVLYWFTNTILTSVQQFMIMKSR